MSTMQYSGKCYHLGFSSNKIHDSKISLLLSTSVVPMVNHLKTHCSSLTLFNCENADIEMYYCTDCDFQTDLTVLLIKHIEKHHNSHLRNEEIPSMEENTIQSYICKKCEFETYFLLKWLQHDKACIYRNNISKLKPIEMQKSHSKLKQYFNCKHLTENDRWYICNKCSYKTKYKRFLNKHKLWKHVNMKDCNGYNLTQTMKKETENCHSFKPNEDGSIEEEKDIQSYICNNCDFETYISLKWLQHTETCVGGLEESQLKSTDTQNMNTKTSGKYTCDQCEFSSKYRISLNIHKSRNHSNDEDVRWYHCKKCPYKTRIEYYLKEHETTKHSKLKGHKCNYCLFQTVSNLGVKRHIYSTHLTSGTTNWYHCDECLYKTKFKHLLHTHKCKHCTYKARDYRQVLSSVNKIERHQYNKCSYKSKPSETLKFHKNKCHPGKTKPNKALKIHKNKCQIEKDNRHNLLNTAEDYELHKCDQCPYIYTKKEYLEQHTQFAHRKPPNLITGFQCNKCNYKTKIGYELKRHMLKYHANSEPSVKLQEVNTIWYKCNLCEFKTTTTENLHWHKSNHNQTKQTDLYTCGQCSYKARFIETLRIHMNRCHLEKEDSKLFKCDQCPYTYTKKEYLEQHIRFTHANANDSESFQCSKCPYIAKIKHELKKHTLKYHSAKKASTSSVTMDTLWYMCEFCGFKANTVEILDWHKISQHQPKSEYKCNHCAYKSERQKRLETHVLNKHLNDNGIEWFECNHCGFRSRTSGKLMQHIRKHFLNDETLWYKCGVCEFITNHVEVLTSHIVFKHAN